MALIRQIPFLLTIIRATPRWIITATNPKALEVLDLEKLVDGIVEELLQFDPEEMKQRNLKTVLWELAKSDSLPLSEKTVKRLSIEGNIILGAGFKTTRSALSHLTYSILNNPEIHRKLLKELENAIPDPNSIPSHQVLKKLPYLYVVVKEGIRQVAFES
jgi:cytochrome P450